MHITARTQYALRSLLALAAAEPDSLTAATLATRHEMPLSFLRSILGELRGAGLIASQRGPDRGYRLTRPPAEISVGEVLRVAAGALTDVPDDPADDHTGTSLRQIWRAADTAILNIVDGVTLADLVAGDLPDHVRRLAEGPGPAAG